MVLELFLSLRYLKAKRKQAFISIISVISILGVMVGVMSLIVVLSVMNGFRSELMSRSLGIMPHIWVSSDEGSITEYESTKERLKSVQGVTDISPSIMKELLLQSSYTTGAYVRGVDPEGITAITGIKNMMQSGDISSLKNTGDDIPNVIIGIELAKSLRIGEGDIIKLNSPSGRLTPLGRTPKKQNFRVSGIFSSGLIEYDQRLIFISFEEAQRLFAMEGKATHLEVKVDNTEQSDITARKIREILGSGYSVIDWKEYNRSLLGALKLEKTAMFIIQIMIVMVGALNIISVLVMTVLEKAKDIAILRTMGTTKKSIMSIFMIQGLIVGITGTLAGVISGLGICYLISNYIFIEIPSDVYPVSTLPVLIDYADVMVVTIAGFLLSFLTTIYPSWHASRLNPVETLRYE
ncbi:MAG: lipoprotein-releasing ABC transporter permease subunit [Desulfatiglans sp.]|jgi:lipoprotein-releasing system permease protein|nr:lipoprotein-releasing ABC transporter permease subunit [Desulfatiglans sp.]